MPHTRHSACPVPGYEIIHCAGKRPPGFHCSRHSSPDLLHVPYHASLSDLALACLELRLDEGNDVGIRLEAGDERRQDQLQRDEGDIDYRQVMRTMLAQPAYDGYIAIEVERSGDPFALMEPSIPYLKEIVAEVQS